MLELRQGSVEVSRAGIRPVREDFGTGEEFSVAVNRWRARDYYWKNREVCLEKAKRRWCGNKREARKKHRVFSARSYRKNLECNREKLRKRAKEGYHKNLDAARERGRERYYADIEGSRQARRLWNQNNRLRVNECKRIRCHGDKKATCDDSSKDRRARYLTKALESEVRERNIGIHGAPFCYLCNLGIVGERGNVEHRIFVKRCLAAGLDPNVPENLDVSHAGCNFSKGERTPDEFWRDVEAVRSCKARVRARQK